MPKTAWPVASEVKAEATLYGVTLTATDAEIDEEVAGIVAELETRTAFQPFLAETVDSTNRLNPPGSDLLDLRAGYHSITSLTIGVVAGSSGTVLVLDTEYYTLPDGAAARKKPITWIRLSDALSGPPRSVKVIGKRGYSDEIPIDVWRAVLRHAAGRQIEKFLGALGTPVEVRQGPVTQKFSESDARSAAARGEKEFNTVCQRYCRL